jgi:hypothetical protein
LGSGWAQAFSGLNKFVSGLGEKKYQAQIWTFSNLHVTTKLEKNAAFVIKTFREEVCQTATLNLSPSGFKKRGLKGFCQKCSPNGLGLLVYLVEARA